MNFNASDTETVWGKYGRMWATSGGQAVFGLAGGPGLPGSDPGLGHTLIQVATVGHSHTFSPNLLLDGVIGYERQGQHVYPNDFGTNYGLQFGNRTPMVRICCRAAFPSSVFQATPVSECRTGCPCCVSRRVIPTVTI